MTVAIIVPNYPPTICGVGDYTYLLIQELLKADLEVHVICSADQKPEPADKPFVYPIVEKWNKQGFQTALDKLETIQPDWVMVQYVPHGYDPRGLPIAILRFYKALTKKAYQVLTMFHEVRVRPGHKLSSRFISAVETYIAHQITRHSKQTVTSIDFYADLLRGSLTRGKIHILPIGTGIEPIAKNVLIQKELKERFDMPPNAPVVVTFGNRDVSEYIGAFDLLQKDYPDLIWLLCGKTSTPKAVLDSRPYFRVTGRLSAEDIYHALSLGDVAFLPEPVNARMEGGSSNKSTALACVFSLGVPVIGIKGDMNNTLLKHNVNIVLVHVFEEDSLYNALKKGLNTEGGQKLGQGARHFYDTALSWDVLGKKFMDLMGIDANFGELSKLPQPTNQLTN